MRLSKQTPQKRIAADYIDLKSSVLSRFLKAAKVNVKSFSVVDRLFQAAGPATENPRLPIVTVFADGVRRSPAAADRRWERPSRDEMGTQRSRKYIGAVLWRHLYTTEHSLNWILCGMESQWSCTRIRFETLAQPGSRSTRRAAARRMDWSLLIWVCGRPARTPLQ